MNIRSLSIVIMASALLPTVSAHAQRRIQVYDPETNRPLDKVAIQTGNGKADTTNILGQAWLPERFDTLRISKPGYVSLLIPERWVEDTVPMIRDYNHIGEVVVYANRDTDFERAVSRWTKADRVETELRNPITGISFNMADLLDKQRRRDKKNAKKMEKIFRQLDGDDENPIIHSYREALKDKIGM